MQKTPPRATPSPSLQVPAPPQAAGTPSRAVSRGSLSEPHSHSFKPSWGSVSNLLLALKCALGPNSLDFAMVTLSCTSKSEAEHDVVVIAVPGVQNAQCLSE